MKRYFTLWRFFEITACVISLSGCKSTDPLTVFVTDTAYLNKEVHDSTYIDRWHTEYQKGDTVYIHDSIDRWHSVKMHDTIYRSKEVPKPYPVEKIVEKELSWLQKTLIGMGVLGLICLIGLIGWNILKQRLK